MLFTWHRINIIFLPLGDVKDIVQLSKKAPWSLGVVLPVLWRAQGSGELPLGPTSSSPILFARLCPLLCQQSVQEVGECWLHEEGFKGWWEKSQSVMLWNEQPSFLTEINVGPWDGGRSFSWYNFEVFQHINRMGMNQCTRFEIMFRIWLFTVWFTVHLNVLGSAGFYLAFRMQNMVGFCNQTCISAL